MKNKLSKSIIILLIISALAVAFSACSMIGGGETLKVTPTKTEVSLFVGESYTIRYDVSDKTKEVRFESTNKSVLTVDSVGKATSVGSGRAKVSLIVSGITKASVTFDCSYFTPEKLEISADKELCSETMENLTFSVSSGELPLDPAYEFYWKIVDYTGLEVLNFKGDTAHFTPETCGKVYKVSVEGRLPSGKSVRSDEVEFGWFYEIESITAAVSAETLELGESVEFSATMLPEGSNQSAVLEWKVTYPSGEEKVVDKKSGKAAFTPTATGEYKVRAAYVSGQKPAESNEVAFTVTYASAGNVVISAAKTKLGIGEQTEIFVSWNKEFVDPNGTYVLTYVVNGAEKDRFDAFEKEYVVFRQQTEGVYRIEVRINGKASNTISIEVVAEYPTARALTLTVGGASDNEPIKRNDVSVTFTVQNDTGFHNPQDVYVWYVNGEKAAEGKDLREFVLSKTISDKKAAEYHVEAECGLLRSKVFTLVQLGENCVLQEKYFEFFTAYGGYLQNTFVTTQEELGNVFSYVRDEALYKTGSLELYVDYSPTVKYLTSDGKGKIDLARAVYPESGKSSTVSARIKDGATTGEIELTFGYQDASDASPSKTETAANVTQSGAVKPTYGKGVSRVPSDDYPEWPGKIQTTNLLYKVLSWGYRPTKDDSSSTVWQVYTLARNAVASIAAEDMTDVQKTLAVYDYICYEVTYDFNLAGANRALIESMKYDGYYLEGVFFSKKAVCDGKSKAFVLMTAMLGLKSVRATGKAQSSSSSPDDGHAWNKVLAETEEKGGLGWYVCDTTWGDVCVTEGGVKTEHLSHKYFMVSDAAIAPTHNEITSTPTAEKSYNYYKNTTPSEDKTLTLECGNRNDFRSLLKYVMDNKLSGVELKLSYSYQSFKNEIERVQLDSTWYKAKSVSWISLDDVYVVKFGYDS